jgi:hypothetical protein
MQFSGDDLAIFLFWAALVVTFGLEAVKASAASHRIGFGVLAAACAICGLLWTQIAKVWPPLTEAVSALATSPQSWFVIFMFVAATFAFGGRRQSSSAGNEAESKFSKLAWPVVSKWMTPLEAIEEFSDPVLKRDFSATCDRYKLATRRVDESRSLRSEIDALGDLAAGRSSASTEAYSEFNEAQNAFLLLRKQLFDDLIRQLKNGTLVARGVLHEDNELQGDWVGRRRRANPRPTDAVLANLCVELHKPSPRRVGRAP